MTAACANVSWLASALELASGALQEHMQALTAFHGMRVLPDCSELPAAGAGKLIAEFKTACAHLETNISQKLRCWQALPWKLCGMAHPSAAIARGVATACIDEFDWSACKTCLGSE
eukprot:279088-Amphidinium_carterae.1